MKSIDPAQWAILVTALGGLVTAIGTLVSSIRNGKKADAAAQKIDDNTALTKEVHEAVAPLPQPPEIPK